MYKEVIIVEGKTDTQKLKNIFGNEIKTIETNGLSLNESTLKFIKKINDKNGVIIFTDPDGPGKKIREQIIEYLKVPVKNAFIQKTDINKKFKKIGIAEADSGSIKKALDKLITTDVNKMSLSWQEYLSNNFYLKENRQKISKYLGWNQEISSKTLFKWLNWVNLSVSEVKLIIGENDGN